MNDSPDLIDKTDALLSRYRGNPISNQESDFPILTDIYDHHPLPVSPTISSVGDTTGTGENPTVEYSDSLKIREKLVVDEVLRKLAPHIDEVLGDPLRVRLDEQLRNTLTALTHQVHIDIETLVKAAVSQAVDHVVSKK